MRGRLFRALLPVAMAAAFVAASAHATECGRSAEGFNAWLSSFRQVAVLDGVSPEVVDAALSGVSYDPSVKAHDGGVAAFGHNFAGFAASHITPGGVARGKAMLRTYAGPLAKIEQRFGVPGPVLVAIWGLETSFGADNGSFPTFRSLATLAWDCRRPERFRAELIDAMMMVQRGVVQQRPGQLRGAWAGEIGQTQLMPSAVLMFATTPDGDGPADLIHNSADALASTANFLKSHGWQPGAGWDEGEPNFAAILQWNSAPIYAKTVALFADRLAGR
ncbi:MAG: lytic murein transglycosylase [Hyphomicrobiales bacterium]|nr:lytic murein transglycosylase [Hyphomicrobiales bacterium]MBV8440722.1 lytic murein transglycosylase [Hyphomicrobiales bacterium]